MDLKAHRIRAHNDEACQQLNAGLVVIPLGVATLGQEAVTRIVKTTTCTPASSRLAIVRTPAPRDAEWGTALSFDQSRWSRTQLCSAIAMIRCGKGVLEWISPWVYLPQATATWGELTNR
jgi:hypothetical protein